MTLAVTDGSQEFFTENPDYKRERDMTPKLSWKCPLAKDRIKRTSKERTSKLILPEFPWTPTKEWGVSLSSYANNGLNPICVDLATDVLKCCLNKKELESWASRLELIDLYTSAPVNNGTKDLTEVLTKAISKVQPIASRPEVAASPGLEVTSSRRVQIAVAAVAVSSVALLALNSPYIRSLFEEEAPQVDSLWQVDSWETVQKYLRS